MSNDKLLRLLAKDRDQYPDWKTVTELKKLRKMPSPDAEPVATYAYNIGYMYLTTNLYDINDTVTFKLTENQLKRRRLSNRKSYRRMKDKKDLEKFNASREDRLQKLLQEAKEPYQKIIFDTESTGFYDVLSRFRSGVNEELLQVSIINEKNEILFNELIRPINHEDWDTVYIHNIWPKDVKDRKPIFYHWEEIQKIFLSATEIIGYSVDCDLGFMREAGIYIPDVPVYDVNAKFAPIYNEWNIDYEDYNWKSLEDCADYYGYKYNAHDSLEDAKATLFCYNKVEEDIKKGRYNERKEVRDPRTVERENYELLW